MRQNRIGSPDVDEPTLGHGAELIDIFATGDGQRHRVSQFFDQESGRERLLVMQCAVQRGHHRLLDLRAAESIAGAHDFAEIECGAVLFSEAQMDLPDGGSLTGIGQIYEEDFVEPAFSE